MRTSLPDNVVLKPDLSPQEQTTNSLLLKEQWSLIQSGVQHKSIKLRADTILVNGKLHGKVSNGMMKLTVLGLLRFKSNILHITRYCSEK